jgi:2-succinyl-5-enolpyruvyl-6-hydroxy-3-cyclohexene-1-carboxylate synthase
MPDISLDFRNTNSLWCSVLVETLSRCGVTQAVISPGSRSTALTIALARHPRFEVIPILDERSAGFFALGLAKQKSTPVVLVCTSGTAGANYFPAVIEAQESGVPLIVVTADRPPEMRECSSGQTIDQQKLFGSHVNWYHELSVPEPSLDLLRYLRQTVIHACERAQVPAPGPVHLNAPFRDPLPPVRDGKTDTLEGAVDWDDFFSKVKIPGSAVARWNIPDEWKQTQRGILVVGPYFSASPERFASTLSDLSKTLDWPILADGLSPLRNQQTSPNPHLVCAFEGILRSSEAARELKPDVVVCVGGWPISKVLREWIGASGAAVWMVGPGSTNLDALHARTVHLRASIEALSLPPSYPARHHNAFLVSWLRCEVAVQKALHAALEEEKKMFEGRVSYLLPWELPEGTPVFVANSMPVRDVEYFWSLNNRRQTLYFNRGANGIDGTLSTALGIAHGNRPTVLLTGDLALLHDTNGFLLNARLRGSLTVVLINNNGGGIFEHLPVSKFDPPFEEFFATPQNVDFARLTAAYGVEHILMRDWPHFIETMKTLPSQGVRVVEVRTDRKHDAAYRKNLFAELSAVASKALAVKTE